MLISFDFAAAFDACQRRKELQISHFPAAAEISDAHPVRRRGSGPDAAVDLKFDINADVENADDTPADRVAGRCVLRGAARALVRLSLARPAGSFVAAPGISVAATDQVIGTGDGATAIFQLVKTYGSAYEPYPRAIVKPIAGSVRVAVDGIEVSEGAGFTLPRTSSRRSLHRRGARMPPARVARSSRPEPSVTTSVRRSGPPALFSAISSGKRIS